MLKLIEDNAKQGAVSEDFDEAYRHISEQINELKKAKIRLVQAKKQAENYKQRVQALDKAMTTVNPRCENLIKTL